MIDTLNYTTVRSDSENQGLFVKFVPELLKLPIDYLVVLWYTKCAVTAATLTYQPLAVSTPANSATTLETGCGEREIIATT